MSQLQKESKQKYENIFSLNDLNVLPSPLDLPGFDTPVSLRPI